MEFTPRPPRALQVPAQRRLRRRAPREDNGKIYKRQLRDQYRAAASLIGFIVAQRVICSLSASAAAVNRAVSG